MKDFFCIVCGSPHMSKIEESEVLPSIVDRKYNSDPG